MGQARVELLFYCLMFAILLSGAEMKPSAVRDTSPLFISSYAKVSRSGYVANKTENATVLGELDCCGGQFKPSAIISDNLSNTKPRLPITDENEESRGYRAYPSRVLEPPVAQGHQSDSVNPPLFAEDRYAAKSIIKSKPSKVVKMTQQRPSNIPYQADFSDTLNTYQAPLPSKPYPSDGPPTSYNPGPPSASYGSPSLDSPNKQAQRIPYAPDYISSQEGQNQVPDSKMPPSVKHTQTDAPESHRPMEAPTSYPADSYSPEEYLQYPLDVMTPPKQKPNLYDPNPDAYLPTPPGGMKHKPKPTHHMSYHEEGEKLHPDNPQIPKYPPESGKVNPYMHSPGPQWIYKPETNEYSYPPEQEIPKPTFDGIEYIDDEEFPHFFHHHHHHHKEKPIKTTEKPMEDHDSEDRQKKPYSYYYLGRKLWFIPLYFSVYFIIYVTALILKSIARHKISYPSLTEEGKKQDRNMRLDDTTEVVYRGIENTRSKYTRMQSFV